MKTDTFPSFTIPVRMRFRDLDAYGHVNNAIMFSYLEEARISLLGERFYDASSHQDLQFLVKKASCEYIRPLLLTQAEILITLCITQMRGASFHIHYSIHDQQDVEYARADTHMVCFDPIRRRPARIPEWFMKHLHDTHEQQQTGEN
ncbi:MAG: acyl-CoA thioesterase [Spirochaeta sp.]